MFDSMMSWLADKIIGAVEGLITIMLASLDCSVTTFLEFFPVASVLYTILQSAALALTLCIAGWGLIKFFAAPSHEAESPVRIAAGAAASGMLIFWGNNLLESYVNLVSYPYADLLAVSAEGSAITVEGISLVGTLLDGALTQFTGGVYSLLKIIFYLVFGWQMILLLLEIVERWLMLGVLVYTSPLAWPAVASQSTRGIFGKWLSMFFSQCIMMLINAWSIKMLFSVIYAANNADHPFLGPIVALTFCHMARQLDSYVRQIGLNPAVVGRSMLDDVLDFTRGVFMASAAGSRIAGAAGHAAEALGGSSQYGASGAAASAIAANYGGRSPADGTAGSGAGSRFGKRVPLGDQAKENAAAAAGRVFYGDDGRPLTGDAARAAMRMYRRNGTLPGGVHVSPSAAAGNSRGEDNTLDRMDQAAEYNHVSVGKDRPGPEGKELLQGRPDDVARMMNGNLEDMLRTEQYGTAAVNTAAGLDPAQLEALMDSGQETDDPMLTAALAENLAEQTGAVSGRSLGEDTYSALLRQAAEEERKGGNSAAYLAARLGTAEDGRSGIRSFSDAAAHAARMQAVEIGAAGSALTGGNRTEFAGADREKKAAMFAAARQEWEHMRDRGDFSGAEDYARRMTGMASFQGAVWQDAAEADGALYRDSDRAWDRLSPGEKQTALDRGKAAWRAERMLGRYEDAQVTALQNFGTAGNVEKQTAADVDRRCRAYEADPDAFRGETADLVFGAGNRGVDWEERGNWSAGRLEQGELRAVWTRRAADPAAGTVSGMETHRCIFSTAQSMETKSPEEREGYLRIRSGSTDFYVRGGIGGSRAFTAAETTEAGHMPASSGFAAAHRDEGWIGRDPEAAKGRDSAAADTWAERTGPVPDPGGMEEYLKGTDRPAEAFARTGGIPGREGTLPGADLSPDSAAVLQEIEAAEAAEPAGNADRTDSSGWEVQPDASLTGSGEMIHTADVPEGEAALSGAGSPAGSGERREPPEGEETGEPFPDHRSGAAGHSAAFLREDIVLREQAGSFSPLPDAAAGEERNTPPQKTPRRTVREEQSGRGTGGGMIPDRAADAAMAETGRSPACLQEKTDAVPAARGAGMGSGSGEGESLPTRGGPPEAAKTQTGESRTGAGTRRKRTVRAKAPAAGVKQGGRTAAPGAEGTAGPAGKHGAEPAE